MTTPTTRSSSNNLQIGSRLSRVSYMEIVGEDQLRNSWQVRNEEGAEWTISKNIVENECYSAHEVLETQEVTRTQMVEALEAAGDTIFTIVFTKQPVKAEVTTKITDAIGDAVENSAKPTKRAVQALTREVLSGAERTLIGYLATTEPKMGRSQVVDLEDRATGSYRLRLVDHRTITSLTIRNIQYVLK